VSVRWLSDGKPRSSEKEAAGAECVVAIGIRISEEGGGR